jgi:hypothetical protein
LLLAIWLLTVVLYFIFIKRSTIKFIPISLFALLLFSLVFPYLNAFAVSKRSQKHELELLLNEHSLLKNNNKIDFAAKIPSDVAASISDKFHYLSERNEKEYLQKYLDSTAVQKFESNDYWTIDFLFSNIIPIDAEQAGINLQLNNGKPYYDIVGYQYVIKQNELAGDEFKINDDLFKFKMITYQKDPIVVLHVNDEQADLMPAVKMLFDKYKGAEGTRQIDNLFVERSIGKYHVKIMFDYISKTTSAAGDDYYLSEALILVKQK